MAETKIKELFESKNVEVFRVRQGLVLPLTKSKTYKAEEQVELDREQYKIHCHKVETEAQYQAQLKLGNRGKKNA